MRLGWCSELCASDETAMFGGLSVRATCCVLTACQISDRHVLYAISRLLVEMIQPQCWPPDGRP
jgi:hypothetical protein